jgi:hypothetical protein
LGGVAPGSMIGGNGRARSYAFYRFAGEDERLRRRLDRRVAAGERRAF